MNKNNKRFKKEGLVKRYDNSEDDINEGKLHPLLND